MMIVVLPIALAVALPVQDHGTDIVVTGQNIEKSRADLATCRAKGCPPDQEINATLLLATEQFLAGDYPGARRTVLDTRHRVARYAKTYPVQVSRLMLADSRLQALDGRKTTARISLIDALDAMRAGLPEQDRRLLAAELQIGEGYAREGRWQPAAELYSKIAKRAADQGFTDIEANALFRRAALYSVIASRDPAFAESAGRAVAAVDHRPEPAFAPYRQGAAAMKVRIAAMTKDLTPDQATAMLPSGINASEPILIYEPRTAHSDILTAAAATIYTSGTPVASAKGLDSTAPEWADFGFRIGRDGGVTDVEVLKVSSIKPGRWVSVAQKAIGSQRYVPLDGSVPTDGLERRIRYSIVHDIQPSTTGTRMVQRSGGARLEVTDLSLPPPRASGSKTS